MTNQPPFHISNRQGYNGRSIFFAGLAILVVFLIVVTGNADAGFASRLSLTLGEEYNDNIFFEKKKEFDFITSISPKLSLLYAPVGQTTPVFNADLTVVGQIFARHSEESNFGDNIGFNSGYTYNHSPRLTIFAGDSLRSRSDTRTSDYGGSGLPPPTSIPPPGTVVGLPSSQRLGDFVSNGKEVSNQFTLRSKFIYDQNFDFVGDYRFGYTAFLDQGGNEISHLAGIRGVYKWREEHNFNLGYSVEVIKSRDGNTNVIHNIDAGDDFFSTFKIQLDPTLSITAQSGIAVNAGGDGPTIANRSNLTITKLWERAQLEVGFNKGLTPSFGVSGVSDTMSFFGNFSARITESLDATATVEYSLFDTKDVNFSTFLAAAGLRYRINRWLFSGVQYTYRSEDAGSGADSTGVLTRGKVGSNSVLLTFGTNFDLWPRFGLGHSAALP